jgi:prevent-host-death family protein
MNQEQQQKIGAGQFKTHCLKLIDEVAQTKRPIIVTKHGQPIAQLVPIEDKNYSLFGCQANTIAIAEAIIEGIGETWEVDE